MCVLVDVTYMLSWLKIFIWHV